MDTPPTRARPTLPDPLPVSAEDLSFRTVGRQFVDLFRFMFREMRSALGQLRQELAALYQTARDPKTSRETLKGAFRGLTRAYILYGAILAVVMPLVGVGERLWQIVLTLTVACMAIEMALGGSWFPAPKKRVSLVKAPRS